ncbi:MAG: type III-A CRISPR-associated RAMP protein Csm3 [Phaeodactylibacter sp.]|nr:type III-A CRISPR-associated RAMP protein Csm3 [Phaeodactylibacter sp.]
MPANTLIPTFKANLILRGKIECLTGLHIGGSKEKMEIGGVDSIVVRTPRNDYPYIPGSSLKGKMRHLLEYILGGVGDPVFQSKDEPLEKALGRVSRKKEIVRIFGAGASEREIPSNNLENIGLTRLVVRDAMPDEETIEMWESLGSDAHFTEYKAENTIDRLTSAANPRFIERVVEGSKFDFEMVYSVFEIGSSYVADTNADLRNLLLGLRLLEGSALGKSGSRGYGKIQFHLADPVWLHQPDYETGSEQWAQSRGKLPAELKGLEAVKFEDIEYRES